MARNPVITYAQALSPALQGYTPPVPSQPRLNAYLDIFDDADRVARAATSMRPTRELDLNIEAPLLWHVAPAPDGWQQHGVELSGYGRGLSACRQGDEFCDELTQKSQPRLATKIATSPLVRSSIAAQSGALVRSPSTRTSSSTPSSSAPAPTHYQPPQQPQEPAQGSQVPTDMVQDFVDDQKQQQSAGSGSTGFPWLLLALLGGGYLWSQR
jgi:hypothetical protein